MTEYLSVAKWRQLRADYPSNMPKVLYPAYSTYAGGQRLYVLLVVAD